MPKRTWRMLLVAVIGLCVLFVGWRVAPHVPREVEVRVPLQSFREGVRRARSVRVTLQRDGETVEELRARFNERTPEAYTAKVSLVPGVYNAVVEVEMQDRVAERRGTVDARAGELLTVPMPRE